jgi:superfamily II DNA helicase RecQ
LRAATADLSAGVRSYNGRMDSVDKVSTQNWWEFAGNPVKIIVATSAFGTGIDLPNVMAVIMLDTQREAYWTMYMWRVALAAMVWLPYAHILGVKHR